MHHDGPGATRQVRAYIWSLPDLHAPAGL